MSNPKKGSKGLKIDITTLNGTCIKNNSLFQTKGAMTPDQKRRSVATPAMLRRQISALEIAAEQVSATRLWKKTWNPLNCELDRLASYLRLIQSKCEIFLDNIHYLGHMVTTPGI